MTDQITTPRGKITTKDGKASLEWNTNLGPEWMSKFSEAQKFVDSEVLRLSEPYVPLRTGMLIMSGILGTVVGSGLVQYIAPYAKFQYYSTRKPGRVTGPLRGPYWFERMKQTHAVGILKGARAIMAKETK